MGKANDMDGGAYNGLICLAYCCSKRILFVKKRQKTERNGTSFNARKADKDHKNMSIEKRKTNAFLGVFVVTFSAFAAAETGVEAKITGCGILKAPIHERVIQTPETPSGFSRIPDSSEIDVQTNRIPTTIGVIFGFKYSIKGLTPTNEVVFKKIVKHPPIQKPDGTIGTEYTSLKQHKTSPKGTFTGFTGYEFDHSYELVPGDWVVELWYGEKKILEQTFQIFNPDDISVSGSPIKE
jgi:hypothetical protein